jgi:hypothetical protein
MNDLIWLHEDALSCDHPVFAMAAPASQACFIWDETYLQQMDYGFKRLLFIYETLLELPVTIIRGKRCDCLARLARQNGGRILVPATPNPLLQQTIARLGEDFVVEVIAASDFVTLSRQPDLKRFFRYWNRARKAALLPAGSMREDSR